MAYKCGLSKMENCQRPALVDMLAIVFFSAIERVVELGTDVYTHNDMKFKNVSTLLSWESILVRFWSIDRRGAYFALKDLEAGLQKALERAGLDSEVDENDIPAIAWRFLTMLIHTRSILVESPGTLSKIEFLIRDSAQPRRCNAFSSDLSTSTPETMAAWSGEQLPQGDLTEESLPSWPSAPPRDDEVVVGPVEPNAEIDFDSFWAEIEERPQAEDDVFMQGPSPGLAR